MNGSARFVRYIVPWTDNYAFRELSLAGALLLHIWRPPVSQGRMRTCFTDGYGGSVHFSAKNIPTSFPRKREFSFVTHANSLQRYYPQTHACQAQSARRHLYAIGGSFTCGKIAFIYSTALGSFSNPKSLRYVAI